MTDVRVIANEEELVPPPVEYLPRRNGTTPLRQRNSEHADPNVERQLLSAALTAAGVVDAVQAVGLHSEHFTAEHQTMWSAIVAVTEQGGRPDPALVLAAAHSEHAVIDEAELVDLASSTLGYLSNAAKYAEVIIGHAHARKARGLLEQASEAVRLGADPHTVLAGLAVALPAPIIALEKLVADMQAVLDGEAEVIIPNLAPRDDHETCLLYAPGINWLDGEPGRGKTMLAMWWCYRELADAHAVVYIAYEGEGNKHTFGARLKQMGLTDASKLHYVHRAGTWTPAELGELRGLFDSAQPSLVVVDSVASAMQAEGLDPESNRDVEQWKATIPSWAVRCDAAFLAIDHLTKTVDTRGRYSIGAQRKLGIADVSYRLLMHRDAGLGQTGYGKLEVMKDREGALGAFQEGRVIADVAIASESRGDTYELRVALTPPASSTGSTLSGPSWYMERVSAELGAHGPLGKVELRTRVGRRKDQVDLAIERLLDEGAIAPVDVPGRAKPYESVYPWHPPVAEPVKSFYETDKDDDI